MHKKVASIVTAAVLLVTMSATAVVATPLSDKLKEQQTTMQQHSNQYKSAQNKLNELERQIEYFDGQIESLMRDIQTNKSKVKTIQGDIEVSEKHVKKAEKEIQAEQDLYNQRMRTMYMNGVGGYLGVILGADNLSDLFEKVEAVKKLTELDKKIVRELRQKEEQLKVKQQQLKREKEKLVTLNKEQENKVKTLEQDKKKQFTVIEQSKKESNLYSDRLKQDQAQISKTKQMIEDMKKKVYSAPSSTHSSSSQSANRPSRRPSRGDSGSVGGGSYAGGDNVVVYASNFLGRKYVWGADGPDTFDCSGFTKYVYGHFGVNLPRVSGDQSTVGSYVSKGDLQPGDLVFFGNGNIHHVGIYVGNDSYIHAPKTGDVVKISSLSARSDYATGRRVK